MVLFCFDFLNELQLVAVVLLLLFLSINHVIIIIVVIDNFKLLAKASQPIHSIRYLSMTDLTQFIIQM